MRIGILNSGGDCPGLNAVIHGVVGAAHTHGLEVVGFRDGFEGLLPPGDYMMLDPEKTVGIMKLGGMFVSFLALIWVFYRWYQHTERSPATAASPAADG
jgi:6-phosphofructokinase